MKPTRADPPAWTLVEGLITPYCEKFNIL